MIKPIGKWIPIVEDKARAKSKFSGDKTKNEKKFVFPKEVDENPDPTTTTQNSVIDIETGSMEEDRVETEVPPKLIVGDITNNKLEDTNIGNEVEAFTFTSGISTAGTTTLTTTTTTTTTTTIKYLTQADGKIFHACTKFQGFFY